MGRPPKWRRVEFIPGTRSFLPENYISGMTGKVILQIEEAEALRLKDIQKLEQEDCASKMEVSRQTFQRILNAAREKAADCIVNGKALVIEGGNYTRNICVVKCTECGEQWEESYENLSGTQEGKIKCSYCGSEMVVCCGLNPNSFCRKNCSRCKRGHR